MSLKPTKNVHPKSATAVRAKSKSVPGRAVLVTTVHRGVFYGRLVEQVGDKVTLEKARCAIRWGTEHGFLQLASDGPGSGSKIGSQADRIELYGVTSIADVSRAAQIKWEALELE